MTFEAVNTPLTTSLQPEIVMRGLDPRIHALACSIGRKTWMPATSAGMTI
jgi:hypothetical protein